MAMLNPAVLLAFVASALAVPQEDEALRSCGEARYHPSKASDFQSKMPLYMLTDLASVHLLRRRFSLPSPKWQADFAMRTGLLQSRNVFMS